MRYIFSPHPRPKIGDKRNVRGFLWWPKFIDGEVRWLESSGWVEVYECIDGPCWEPIQWVD